MLQKAIFISLILAVISCSSYDQEAIKSAKAKSAASRINDTQNNSSSLFKEIDN